WCAHLYVWRTGRKQVGREYRHRDRSTGRQAKVSDFPPQVAVTGILTAILLSSLASSSRGVDEADPKKKVVSVEQVKGWLAGEAARTTDKRKDYSWETFKLKHDLNHPGQQITGDELNKYDPPSRVVDEHGKPLPSGHHVF